MRTRSRNSISLRRQLVFVAAFLCFAPHNVPPAAAEPADQKTSKPATSKQPAAAEIAIGREIFLREWLPNDPRSHGGDGLGPVFNDTSCVACHNLGGAGGGGPASKNVDILTAAPVNPTLPSDALQDDLMEPDMSGGDFLAKTMRIVNGFRMLVGAPQFPNAAEPKNRSKINVDELAKVHPGFRKGRSIVLPRFGTEAEFEKWHPTHAVNALESLQTTETIDLSAELHPFFKATFETLLRKIGVKLEPEAVPQPQMAPAPVAVSRTVILERPERVTTPPFEVWRQGEGVAEFWGIGQSLVQTAQWLINLVAIPFSADAEFGMEADLAPEAMGVQFIRSMGGRSDILTMSFGNGSTSFGSALKKANAQLVPSHRNPTALFGAGLIDSIPDTVLEAAAASKHRDFPSVTGRVSRLRDGRIGKFGWKGQIASLRDFTVTACAVELGLNVPGHEQAVVPYKPEYRSPGFDLTEKECDALVAYLASLPSPSRARPENEKYTAFLDAGEKLFAETGCVACHTQKLGDVDGIYSDLLLHDMGPALADSGNYGSILPEDPDENDAEPAPELVAVNAATNASQQVQANCAPATKQKSRSPRRSEWRTPPLWGVRDSGPYLHDGSAETIQDAIAMHGGEALTSTNRYFKLPHEQRQQLIGFLKSLTAPEPVGR